jgi:gamma-glutamyltranspeptidase/glutathione hydrolase
MALMAHIVEGYDVTELGWHSTHMIHLLAESWKRAYSDRNQVLADPDYIDLPLSQMISRDYGRERSADISLTAATPSANVGPGLVVSEGSETTHFSVVDETGNAVAVTTTLNSLYGSKVTVEGAGFLLNNEMDDFATKPGFPNQFGLVQGEQNAIEPGKRMLSAMTPTVVENPEGELFLVLGTPGGGTIITTVFQTFVNIVDFGMSLTQAVNAPRIHHQHLPDRIMYEQGGLTDGTADSLRALGHAIGERRGTSGDVQAIMVLPDGTLVGYADPRRGGLSAGY